MDDLQLNQLGQGQAPAAALLFGSLAYTIGSMLTSGFRLFMEGDRQADLSTLPYQNSEDTFDFIIVGGGVTGSSLASKLSQRYSVLVLEAGSTPSPIHLLPTISFLQGGDPSIDWRYKTVPQNHACFGLNNNSEPWPSGKVLGGSSLLNAMMYLRGNVQGFDEIAEKTGDNRWKMMNLLRYYKALEDYNGWFDKEGHGQGGLVPIERPVTAKFTDHMMLAGQELGYRVRDPNEYGPYTEGFAKMDMYMSGGRRSDAYDEFLRPLMMAHNNNLVVRKFAYVTRILFNTSTNEAYGVEYVKFGKQYVVKARLEVILSAGAIRTAQLLMLSGVGPKDHLKSHGITPVANLPVGQYLQDKYGALIGPFLVKNRYGTIIDRDLRLPDLLQWLSTGEGRGKSSLSEGTWAILTETAKRGGRTRKPDIHTYLMSLTVPDELFPVISRAFNFKPAVMKHFSKAAKVDSFFQLVTLNAAVGKGYVKLENLDPFNQPIIEPKYLENDEDTRALLEGVKLAVKLVENTTAMQQIHGKLMPGHLPGCEAFEFKSDQYYECVLRHVTLTAYKYAGTAPIGKGLSDPDAVVDSHLRVLLTKRLRVVDSSVLQQRHSSINDITCRMLGQFAGDIILDDWRF